MLNFKRLVSTFYKSTDGFSLIEAAMVLAILGTVAGYGLPILIQNKDLQKHKITRERLAIIRDALALYAVHHKRLPCPSPDPNLGIIGQCTASQPNSHKGYIPFRDLGLPQAITKDGSNYPISYAVDIDSCHLEYDFHDPPQQSSLYVYDETNHLVCTPGARSQPVVILISHGQPQSQNYDRNQNQNRDQRRGKFESVNLDMSQTYYDAPLSKAADTLHGDILHWYSFEQLYFIYGKGQRPQEQIYKDIELKTQPDSQAEFSPSTNNYTTPSTADPFAEF